MVPYIKRKVKNIAINIHNTSEYIILAKSTKFLKPDF